MADAPPGPVVSRPLAFSNEERRAVHSWSRISSAGHEVLLDALKVLGSDPAHLLSFLAELGKEGVRPNVLRSQDVYGYRSCMTRPLTQDLLKPPNKTARPAARRRAKRGLTRKREVHPSWSCSDRPRIQGVCPPEETEHRFILRSRTPTWTPDSSAAESRPCLRLTNIQGLSGFSTARLQIHTSWAPWNTPPSVLQPQAPPPMSGIPPQPSTNGGSPPDKAVALFSQRSLSCPTPSDGALIGDSAPVFYANGRAFPETPTELSNGWRSNGVHRDLRRRAERRSVWKDKSLRWKVIKVDDSRSVDEACRKAQKILQVNLSPVIRIQPLNHALRDFRCQNQ